MKALPLVGRPITVRFCAGLRAHRGKLLDASDLRGIEVHAASFVRRREIVFDSALKEDFREYARVFVHELFHFTWVKLGNGLRRDFENVLEAEMRGGACGELGWSAEMRKVKLVRADWARRTRAWREYACESFCETGAWLYSGVVRHREFTLEGQFRRARRQWFERSGFRGRIPV